MGCDWVWGPRNLPVWPGQTPAKLSRNSGMKQVKTSAERGRSRHACAVANPVIFEACRVASGVALVLVAAAALLVPLGCHRSNGSASAGVLVINEISATPPTDPLSPGIVKDANGATILDETGGVVDWVEIYNPTSSNVSLAGYSLTDDPSRPRRYRFPVNRVLGPGEFALVLLSGDRSRGPRHAPFRLRTAGETVYLFNAEGRHVVDRKGYVQLEPNASVGRYPDGPVNSDYDVIYVPTPGAPNKMIGIKPPRIRRVRLLDDATGGAGGAPTLDTLTVEVNILDDNVEFLTAAFDGREGTCSLIPTEEDVARPSFCVGDACVDLGAVEISEPLVELRRDVAGNVRETSFHLVQFRYGIPTFPDETVLRLDIEAENEVGFAVRNEPVRVGVPPPTLVINEYQPRNQTTISLPRWLLEGVPDETDNVPFPDWFEIYNYGDKPIELSQYAVVGPGAFRRMRSPDPGELCPLFWEAPFPPDSVVNDPNIPDSERPRSCLFVWRFSLGFEVLSLGLESEGTIEPGEHVLIVADGDEAPYNLYQQPGGGDFLYSVDFQLSGENPDFLAIIDECGSIIDSADFDFSQEPITGAIPSDLSVGRLPDAAAAKEDVGPDGTICLIGSFSPGDGFLTPGCRLECPTPGESNIADCEVAPFFSDLVTLNLRFRTRRLDRCHRGRIATEIRSYLYLDEETFAEDTFDDRVPDDPMGIQRFEVEAEFEFTDPATGETVTELLTRFDDALIIHRDRVDESGEFVPALDPSDACVNPDRPVAVDIVRLTIDFPALRELQSTGLTGSDPILPDADGVVVRFALRARDLRFVELLEQGLIDDPTLADWVTLDEASFPQTSTSFALDVPVDQVEFSPSRFAEAPAVVINEIMTANDTELFGMYPDQVGNPDFDPPEFLELYNFDDDPVDIGGMYLANALGTTSSGGEGAAASCDQAIDFTRRYQIADGTVLPPQGYWLFLFVDENSADPLLDDDLASKTTLVRTDVEADSGGLRVSGSNGMVLLVAGDDASHCVLDARCWSNSAIPRSMCGATHFDDVDPLDAAASCCLDPVTDQSLAWIPDRDPRLEDTPLTTEYGAGVSPTPGLPNCFGGPPEVSDVSTTCNALSPIPATTTVVAQVAARSFLTHLGSSDLLTVEVTAGAGVDFQNTIPTPNDTLPADGTCRVPLQFQIFFFELGSAPEVEFTITITDPLGRAHTTDTIRFENCSPSADTTFIRGDANDDTRVNLADMILVFREVFFGAGAETQCADAFDIDDDGAITATDGILLGDYLFLFGTPPAAPFPTAGTDPTPGDDLQCAR